VRLDDYPERSHVARLRYKQNYRDLEGELTLMAHTTSAPIQWLRVAAALKTYEWLVEDDPAFPTFQQLTGMAEDRARMETGRFAPTVTRRIKRRRGVLPGPPMVA